MADGPDFAANPCCALWEDKFTQLQNKYSKSEGARKALRNGIDILNLQNKQMQTDIDNLKKARDEVKQHAENETKEKEKESSTRLSLENEVSALKSEILSLRQNECAEVQCLNGELTRVNEELIRVKEELKLVRQFGGGAEMNQLKDQLQEARTLKRKAEEEKKRVDVALKIAEAGKSKADEELRLLRARSDSGQTEMNQLRDQLREVKLQVDLEKRKAEAEKSKADEELRLLRACGKSRETEINQLRDQLREVKLQVDLEKRKAEAEKSKAEAQKSKADEELKLLRACGNSGETEMNQLRDQLQEVKLQLDLEKRKAESEKSKAEEELRLLRASGKRGETEMNQLRDQLREVKLQVDLVKRKSEAEKGKADEELKLLRASGKSGETEMNELRDQLREVKLQVDLEKRKAEAEKSKADEELKLLEARGISGETEMNHLRDQLRELKLQVDLEKRKSKAEKKRADDAWKHVEAEKSRADEINLFWENLQDERTRAIPEQKRKSDDTCETSKCEEGGLQPLEADKEREKSKEPAGLCLEDEISSLKSQILSLQQREDSGAQNVNDELESLRVRISEGEREIKRLNKLLDKEKMRADSMKKKAEAEKKKVEAEKKKANEALEIVKGEKIRVDEERRIADSERKKAEENRLQVEKLKLEADEARSKLVSLTLESEEANKKLEAERQLLIKERKRADLEKDKAEKQRKLADISMQNALEEKSRADRFRQQLEEDRQKFDDLRKKNVEPVEGRIGTLNAEEFMSEQLDGRFGQPKKKVKRGTKYSNLDMKTIAESAEAYREKALEEKTRADQLSQQLEESRRMIEDLRKQRLVLITPEKLDEPPAGISMSVETAKMKLLKQELKLEKRQVKHAKEVVKLEKGQRKILQQELSRIKTEFKQFSHRLELCNCFTDCHVGIGHLAKNGYRNSKRKLVGSDVHHMQLHSANELLKPSCAVIDDNACFKQCIECSAPMPPKSGNHTECTSGTTFKLQPLLRGFDRKTLHSSAIDSSMASFSDNPLVGSQGRCAFSISKSAEEKSNPQLPVSRLSGEVNRSEYNTNIAVVAENNVSTPVDVCGNIKKRKQILDAVESVEYQFSGGKNCNPQVVGNACMLNHILESQIDNSSQEWSHQLGNFQANVSKKDRHRQKRSRILEKEVVIEHFGNSNVEKDDLGRKPVEQGNEGLRASSPLNFLAEIAQAGKDGTCESVGGFSDYFEEVLDGNYMKLLDLDDAADEERYRLAILKPLSPSLPEIEIKDSAAVETDVFDPSNGCITEKLSNLKDSMVQICNSDTMNEDMDSSKSTSMHAFISCVSKIQDSSMKRGISDIGNNGSTILCGSKFVSTDDDSPQHCVVFSSISESSSLSKIYCTMRSLKKHCLFSQTTIAVQNLMSALVEVDNLLPKEKVCVFFSLLLNNCCWHFKDVVDGDFIHFLNFSIGHMMKVMSDVETKRILAESCILDELITLIEDFLIERRVLVRSDGYTAPSVQSDRRVNIIQDNGNTSLSFQTASTYQLVCGAIALASLCAVYDCIGFLCEASYNVARMRKLDSSVLTTLHAFANICGSKYFALSGYSLIMDVMKSLVTFKENESRSAGFTSSHQVMPLEWPKFQLCTHCPFSEGAVPLNVLTSRLLEKLHSSSRLHKFGLITCQLKADFDGTLCDLGDVISLLELVASNMSWDWTCDNIVVQLLVILESQLLESTLAAGLILLGQLARIGIDANGYKDSTVKKIKGKICAFLSDSAPNKVGPPIQIVAVSALLGMMSLSLEQVIERNMEELPEVDCIRKWFSLLKNEEKSLAYMTLKC